MGRQEWVFQGETLEHHIPYHKVFYYNRVKMTTMKWLEEILQVIILTEMYLIALSSCGDELGVAQPLNEPT